MKSFKIVSKVSVTVAMFALAVSVVSSKVSFAAEQDSQTQVTESVQQVPADAQANALSGPSTPPQNPQLPPINLDEKAGKTLSPDEVAKKAGVCFWEYRWVCNAFGCQYIYVYICF